MKNPLKTGLITAAGSQLANLVSDSAIGAAAYTSMNSGYGLEKFVNGATQAGAFAGLTIAAYGATKLAIEKGVPFASKNTNKAASITSAASVAYGLARTDIFQNALYNMTAYDNQVARALETIGAMGIFAGLTAAGTFFAKDLYDLVASKVSNLTKKKL